MGPVAGSTFGQDKVSGFGACFFLIKQGSAEGLMWDMKGRQESRINFIFEKPSEQNRQKNVGK